MSTDAELLQRYVSQHDERAFAELVQRYLGLVYAAALRRVNGRAHLAEEIAQKVFSDLARRAPTLLGHPALTGWLYRTTRYVAIDAIRAEQRREKLAESLRAMPDDPSFASPPVDWERLRPVIDEALDQLKEHDREILLLRFFNGLPYAEVGQRLDLTENAARMRAERALDKLRVFLGQRGVTSTSSALGLLLASQAFAAAPASLAPIIASAALATAAQASATGVASFLLMNKIALPVLSAGLAAGLTTLVWTAVARDNTRSELATLRAENVRLVAQASTPATAAANAAVPTTTTSASNAAAIVVAMDERQARLAAAGASASTAADPAHGHRNRGQATPLDAGFTLAWAGTIGDVDALSKLIWFDEDARKAALGVIADLPESVRSRYPTPEAFYGFLFALDGVMLAPPPRIETMERMVAEFEFVEISPGRVASRRKGTSRNFQVYQQTAEGWKIVIPTAGVLAMPKNLNGDVLAKFGGS